MSNPYRDAFDKYVMRTRMYGPPARWEARTGWTPARGFSGARWERYLQDLRNTLMARDTLGRMFAWSVPTSHAIQAIADLGPVVEIGAGTGYWAWMLQQAGCEAAPFDIAPAGNEWADGTVRWTEVQKGTPAVLGRRDYRNCTLLLAWPPHNNPMALECLREHHGGQLVYVGELAGGACGTRRFFVELYARWRQTARIELPQWPGHTDSLTVWQRR